MTKQRALMKRAEWLAYCLEIGFTKDQLPELEKVWDTYKDEYGNMRPVQPKPQPVPESVDNKLKEVHEWVEHVVKEIGMVEGNVASVSKYGGSMVVRFENKHGYIVSINKANQVRLDEVQVPTQTDKEVKP